eukprot:CAMPEP_0201987070 /NCGR_PEP_ID=MMETSP0904-20121228/91601_1 /ASSEMBLY_ACC=CAM_ASM_000553 /TAXON_ID=420261 /ORGANISM="Thalassiosira antarctica, Strain CCMP982" /LENGTH=456 /DNA_ID=CAMNT_0048541159 /DNA_START=815 /DNA_END=2186 /DNA_ORIENTATION=-
MTTAAVLGGWSTFGGADYVQNSAMYLWRSLPESIQCRVGFGGEAPPRRGNTKGGGDHLNHEEKRHLDNHPTSPNHTSEQASSPSKTDPKGSGVSFHFVRDMSIVGVLRGLTVVLGLIALEHVPVSFVETIKATAPAFTVLFARLILQERTATPVMLALLPVVAGLVLCSAAELRFDTVGFVAAVMNNVSFVETIKATAPAFTVLFARLILQERTATPVMLALLPVVAGLVLCSAAELRFDTVGFVAAVMNNCADCVQNVMSKKMLAKMKPTQLQFYTSVAALMLQTPFVLRDATGLIRKWTHPADEEDVLVMMDAVTEDDNASLEEGLSLTKLLIIDAVFYHLQSVSAYCTMGCVLVMMDAVTEDDNASLEEGLSLTKLLIIDAVFYHLQSVSAYCTMGCMSPVSQSVANTLKRALLVWASILYFGNPVTNSGIVGIMMVVAGVFLYNHVRRIYQS